MLKVHVKKAGLQSLVQDGGRVGYQAFGVPLSGPMDRFSAKLANLLVQNDAEGPVLEITLMGPVLEFDKDCQIAITGANLSPQLNGHSVVMYQTLSVEKNSTLTFGRPMSGCRSYIGIKGSWLKAELLKSRSSFFDRDKKHQYNVLNNNSVIVISNSNLHVQHRFPVGQLPARENPAVIRVLAGPEFEEFSPYNIGEFFSRTFTLSNDSSRMGYRIEPVIQHFSPSRELISSGIVPGTIQVSNSGQPIILMADAQTSGGYFRIANVITADMPILAQLKPRDQLRFALVTAEEAQDAMEEREKLLKDFVENNPS